MFDPQDPGIIMSVPAVVVRRVRSLLAVSGAILSDLSLIQNCTSSSLVGLPEIRIEFPTGMITLSPEEYVAINEDNDTCALKLYPLGEGPGMFNP